MFINESFGWTRYDGLPSWVPDLHHLSYEDAPALRIEALHQGKHPAFQASTKLTEFQLGHYNDEILLRAKVLDKIVLVHTGPPDPGEHQYNFGVHRQVKAVVELVKWESSIASVVLHELPRTDTVATAKFHVNEDTYLRTLLMNCMIYKESEISMES